MDLEKIEKLIDNCYDNLDLIDIQFIIRFMIEKKKERLLWTFLIF